MIQLKAVFDYLVARYNPRTYTCARNVYYDLAEYCYKHNPFGKELLWSNGDKLLTPSLEVANVVADWLDELGACAVTGYYDPEEDAQSGMTDECTGNWYIDI